MHTGKRVFAQLMDHLPRYNFRRRVANILHIIQYLLFPISTNFLCMALVQLTCRESLRDIKTCLRAHLLAVFTSWIETISTSPGPMPYI
jgi:hypothetical protein